MSTHTHTLGRLVVKGGWSIYADGGKTPVADACIANNTLANDEANARRLVAAWNACDGLHTESLERNKPLADQLVDALNQRDDLLAALKVLHARYVQCIGNEGPEALAARAAIQKVEGK